MTSEVLTAISVVISTHALITPLEHHRSLHVVKDGLFFFAFKVELLTKDSVNLHDVLHPDESDGFIFAVYQNRVLLHRLVSVDDLLKSVVNDIIIPSEASQEHLWMLDRHDFDECQKRVQIATVDDMSTMPS